METKLTLVKLLKIYDVDSINKRTTDLEFSEIVIRRPKYGVKCLLKKRLNNYLWCCCEFLYF